jgi:predicted amidohydrolase
VEGNRVGNKEGIDFIGCSAVWDPYGNLIFLAEGEESLSLVEIDHIIRENSIKDDTDYSSDRSPDLYSILYRM